MLVCAALEELMYTVVSADGWASTTLMGEEQTVCPAILLKLVTLTMFCRICKCERSRMTQ